MPLWNRVLCVACVLSMAGVAGATAYTSIATQSWSSVTTWSPNGTPGAADTVTIAAGTTVTMNTTATVLSVTINVGGTLTMGANNVVRVLTTSGDLVVNGTVNNNSTGTNNSIVVGGNFTNAGTVNLWTTNTRYTDITFNGAANQAISGAGTWVIANVTFNMSAQAITTTNTATNNFWTWGDSGAIAPSTHFAVAFTQGTYVHNTSLTAYLSGGNVSIQGTAGLTVTSGTLNFCTTTSSTVTVFAGGTVTVNGGTLNIGTASLLSNLYVSGGLLSYINVSSGSLTVSNAITTNTASVSWNYTQSGGTVTVGAGTSPLLSTPFILSTTTSAGNTFTMSGGTLILQNSLAGSTAFEPSAATTSVSGGTVQFGNASTPVSTTFLINSGLAGTPVTVGSVVVFNSNVTLDSNTYAMSVLGNWTNNGAFTAGTQTVTLSGTGAQTIGGTASTTFYNLTLSGAGTKTLATSETVSNVLTDNGTLDLAGLTLTLSGAVSNLAGSGTITNSTGTGTIAGTVTVATGAALTLNAPSPITCSGAWTLTGTLTLTGAAATKFSLTLTANNTLTLNGSGLVTVTGNLAGTGAVTFSGSQTLDLGAGFTNTGAFTQGTGTVEYVAAGAQTVRGGITYYGLNILGTGTKTVGAATTVAGALTVNSTLDLAGLTLTLSNAAPTVSGTGTLGSSTGAGTISSAAAVGVSSSGTLTVGVVGGTVTFGGVSGAVTVSSGTVKLATAVTVGGTLTSNGTVDLNGQTLTLSNATLAGTGTVGSSTVTGTISAAAVVTASSAGTLTLGVVGGTVAFGGASGAVTVSSGTVKLATAVTVGGTLTCNAPGILDLNAQTLTLSNATLAGTGTVGSSFGTGTVSATSAVGVSSTTTLTLGLTGGTVSFGGASGAVTVSSGTAKLATAVTVGGTLTCTTPGILDLNAQTLTLSNATLAGTGTVGSSSGTGTVSATTAVGISSTTTLTLGLTGGTVAFGGASGAVSVTAGTVLLASAVSVGGTFANSATWSANGQTTTVTGLATLSAGTYLASTAAQTFNGGLTVSGGTFTGSTGNVAIPGNFSISLGTFTAPAAAASFTIGGNFSNTGGTFTHNSGTVTFNGAGATTISGTTTFNNFRCTTSGKTINFTAGTTQTVAGTLTLTGTSGAGQILLRSTATPTTWSISVTAGAQNVSYVDVKDSNALTNTITVHSGTNSGNNNVNWIFTISKYWVGGIGTWSNTANWSLTSGGAGGASVPGGTDDANFNGLSGGGTCTVDVAVSVGSLTLATGNTTTLSQGANTITVGAIGWVQQAGTFTGGSASITLSGPLSITGGTFTSTTGTLSLTGDFTNSGTFTHNGGTVQFAGAGSPESLSAGGAALNNVNQTGAATVQLTGNLTVNGTLTVTSTVDVQANTLTMAASATFAGTGTLKVGAGGTLFVGPASFASPPTVTLDSASTVNYNAAGAQTVRATTYGNLTLSGSGTKTLAAGTTTVNGTLSVNGTDTLDLGVNTLSLAGAGPHSVASGATLAMTSTGAAAPTLSFASGAGAFNVNGTFSASWSTGTKPTVTGAAAGTTNLQLLGATVNITGMAYSNGTASGLQIGQNGGTDSTVTDFKNVAFTNATAGGRHLYYKAAGGGSMVGIGCSFDSTFGAGKNVKCDTSTATPPYAVCVMARATGAGAGSGFTDGTGTGIVTWTFGGDYLTTAPGVGESRTNPSSYTGVQGALVAQYNWYSGNFIDNYVLSRQNTGNDLLTAVDGTGAIRGTYSISQAIYGNVVANAFPWTATLGNSPGTAEVAMFVTTNGYIFVVQDFTTTLTSAVAAGAATLPVNSTTGFAASGTLLLGSGATLNTVAYTGTTATSFTGCTGVSNAQVSGAQVSLSSGMLANYAGFPVQPRNSTTYSTVVCQAAYCQLIFDAGADGVAGGAGDTDDFFYFTGCSVAPGSATYNNTGASTNQVIRTKCFTAGAQGQCVSGFPVLYGAKAARNWPTLQTLSGTTYLHIATDNDVDPDNATPSNQAHIIRMNVTTGAIDQNYAPAAGTYRPGNHTRGAMQIVTDPLDPNANYIYIGCYQDLAVPADNSKFFSINSTSTSPATYKDQWTPFAGGVGNDIDSTATFGSSQIFFGDSGGLLHAISRTSGVESSPWPLTLEAGQAIRSSAAFPTAGSSNLYIGNDNGKVFQVNTSTPALVNTFRLGDGRMVRSLSAYVDSSNKVYLAVITSDGYEFLLGPF